MVDSILEGRYGHARVAVLTVIPEEFDAVQAALRAYEEVGVTGVYTPAGGPLGADQRILYPFVLAQCPNRSNTPASQQTRRLLEYFRPEVVILVGIAGGVQRLTRTGGSLAWSGPDVGDVVIADYVHYADFTKNLEAGHYLRYFPIDQPSTYLLGAHAYAVVRQGPGDAPWHHDMPCQRPYPGTPRHFVGEVISVEGLAGDPKSARQQELLRHFDNALAVDMESMGVGRAIHEYRDQVHYNPLWMCVRGISDPVRSEEELNEYGVPGEVDGQVKPDQPDNNETRKDWKPYAAAVAARCTLLLLERLLREDRPPCSEDPGSPSYKPEGGWI